TLLSAVIFGLTPALRAARPNLVDGIKERGSQTGGIRSNKLRSSLVILEVALSLVLLIGAGLLLRSFSALQEVKPGFRSDNVLTFSLPLPFVKYRTPAGRTDFYLRLKHRLEALPGVLSAGGITPLPLAGGDQYYIFSYGRPGVSEEDWNRNKADYRWTVPGYFEAMDIRLVAGRLLNEADNQDGAQPVVLVDDKLAERTWPGEDPVDRELLVERFKLDDFTMERASFRVVGVVEHIRSESLADEGREAIYFPHNSFPYAPQSFTLSAAGNAAGLIDSIQSEVEALDPDVPVADLHLMDEYIFRAMAPIRFTLALITAFAALALVLAFLGLYAVMAVSVQQRTQEIGVRMAFGAQGKNVLRLVVGQAMTLALSGVLIGVVAALVATRLVSSLLFAVTATDPATFVLISVLLLGVATAASYVPAKRAVRVDPLHALTGTRAR
ncbi:MAG TPA: FtsX-like permease family protein, partial [Acidobacteriota bacterium]|nr:FtsX-like permease family protein [Acidobacteriota bacterium]